MSMLHDAVNEGIQIGMEESAFERCEGRDCPEDRCPQPIGQCICAYVWWKRQPWWKRVFSQEPPRPSADECIKAMVGWAVDGAIDDLQVGGKP